MKHKRTNIDSHIVNSPLNNEVKHLITNIIASKAPKTTRNFAVIHITKQSKESDSELQALI